ncbi:CII family transcriptional regulator [Burkholderia gladioli]|uniref:CII family transcriptional regulator n=1 Tax=Burkholderia gladioli TaxID=28095 RepID=UPI001C5FB859|nr:CII family transcriptional regulator [Burkholderia gladioli]MBW5285965.1 MarR family transcriptional regulator [Burkholderia gladioli]
MSTPAEAVSPDEMENTRKIAARNESEALRAIARATQSHAATCMGVSASTVSRMLDDLPKWSHLFAAVGLQFAPIDAMVVEASHLLALESLAGQYLDLRRQQTLRGRP